MSLSDPFFVRNLVYGTEDSLLSTTGVVVGVSLSGFNRREVIVTGIILVIVEALSMAFGSFVSEDTWFETAGVVKTPLQISKYAGVMFVSYIIAGLIPMIPFILDVQHPAQWSAGMALGALFSLLRFVDNSTRKSSLLTGIAAVILAISVGAGKFMKAP